MSRSSKSATAFFVGRLPNPAPSSGDSPLIRVNIFLSQHLEAEDKTGLNRKGNAFVHPKAQHERNTLLLDKKERMTDRYQIIRPYLTNLFQDHLRFDPKAVRTFIDSGFDVVKSAEKFVEANDGVFGNERVFENSLAKLYDFELADIGFIKVTLIEFMIFFYTLDHKIELHAKKYPFFGREDRRTLDKLRDVVGRVAEKIKLGRNSPSFYEFVRKMLQLEDRWVNWKNKKCVEPLWKRSPVELGKRGITRRLRPVRWHRGKNA